MTMTPRKSDSELEREIACELAQATCLESAAVRIHVKDGVVILTGTVDCVEKLDMAQAAAHRVSGVFDVANELAVKVPHGSAPTDTEIARAIRRAIVRETLVPDQLIRSTVADGIVTLEGMVDYLSQRYDAEKAVSHIPGVKHVANRIEVRTIPESPRP